GRAARLGRSLALPLDPPTNRCKLIGPASLRLAEEEIDDPAATDVRPGAAAVVEDGAVGAAGVFERVGKYGQVVEVIMVVDVRGKGRQESSVPGEPGGGERSGSERGENVTKALTMNSQFSCETSFAEATIVRHDLGLGCSPGGVVGSRFSHHYPGI